MARCNRAGQLLFLLTILSHATRISSSLRFVLEDNSAAAMSPVGHMATQQQLLQNTPKLQPTRNWEEAETQQQQPEQPLLQDNRPYVIAHRGASGLLPEHTIPAYNTAIAQGADFIGKHEFVRVERIALAMFLRQDLETI